MVHGIRIVSGAVKGDSSLPMHYYDPEVLKCIALGLVVKIKPHGILSEPGSAFGFNRCVIATFMISHPRGVFDRHLLQMLAIDAELYAEDTPPVGSMSPNHKGATENVLPLDEITEKEKGIERTSYGSTSPHFLPLHVPPLSFLLKPGTVKHRKVGDFGHPIDGKVASSLGPFYFAPNANCKYRPKLASGGENLRSMGFRVGIFARAPKWSL